jgi:hypothetical protein
MSLNYLRLPCSLMLLLAPFSVAAQQSWFADSFSYGTQPETDPPRYVRNLGTQGGPAWLELGLDYRLRYEYRDDDLRRPLANGLDDPLLLRTRLYAGLQLPDTPLKFVVEIEDARRNHSRFARDDRDVNEVEPIQAFAELQWPALLGEDARGNARPLRLRGGRLAFELLDRRLVARNEWRNTSNNFDGLRLTLGSQHNDWQLDAMRLHPVQRKLTTQDDGDAARRLDVVVGTWRRWSAWTVLEPHYLRLRQTPAADNGFVARDVRTLGLRAFGRIAASGVDYDLALLEQYGSDAGRRQDARAFTTELGYRWQHAWQPRLSWFHAAAEGDRSPTDAANNRFERYFGFARPWSANDYIVFENLISDKLRLEFTPLPGLRMDAGLSRYRLDSARDRFPNLLGGGTAARDASGASGRDLGDEFDLRARVAPLPHLALTLGYAHMWLGDFVQARQRAATGAAARDSDFFYVELSASLW